jgi:hypothetical protein
MKKQIILFLVCLASMSKAQVTSLSETNNGIFIAISGGIIGTNGAVPFDKRLVWLPFCATNTGGALIELQYPNARYGMKIKMTGQDGKEVSKTDLGEIYGLKWDQLHSYKDSRLNGAFASGPYQPELGAEGGQFLPAPDDLFEMDKPGIYTLEIQMQMFRHTGSTDPEDEYRHLIRFSPVKIKVEKPNEK